jgi:ketosteroid isomerase-like protein
MRLSVPVLFLLITPLPLAAQVRSTDSERASIHREVEARTRAMAAAFGRGDMRAVARFYADDARLYASGTRIEGRAEIDRFWGKIERPLSWVMETIEVGGSRDEPYQLIRSTLVEQIRSHSDTSFAICLLIWKREANGQLRIRLDVYANYPHSDFDVSLLRSRYGIRPREN